MNIGFVLGSLAGRKVTFIAPGSQLGHTRLRDRIGSHFNQRFCALLGQATANRVQQPLQHTRTVFVLHAQTIAYSIPDENWFCGSPNAIDPPGSGGVSRRAGGLIFSKVAASKPHRSGQKSEGKSECRELKKRGPVENQPEERDQADGQHREKKEASMGRHVERHVPAVRVAFPGWFERSAHHRSIARGAAAVDYKSAGAFHRSVHIHHTRQAAMSAARSSSRPPVFSTK